ncbi:hypothetical protein NPIL_48841 [Nephila pilipes]|uniref:Uncharacterized protein n=1 Tax=Nephila pilipes TaxID=299642 RepID=A0A8X6NAX3_NEPPI|nr:hypothetical protein NPIL_48841 [Nephila pilipes]
MTSGHDSKNSNAGIRKWALRKSVLFELLRDAIQSLKYPPKSSHGMGFGEKFILYGYRFRVIRSALQALPYYKPLVSRSFFSITDPVRRNHL